MTSAGGGGGGYLEAGTEGKVVSTFLELPADKGPPAAGGVLYDPFPEPEAATVLEHFLVERLGRWWWRLASLRFISCRRQVEERCGRRWWRRRDRFPPGS